MTTKHCPRCDKMQLIANFSKSSRALSGLQTHCKACSIDMARIGRAVNPERRRAIERASRLKHAAHNQWRTIQRRAVAKNIPCCGTQKFRAWFDAQKPECDYCGITNDESVKQFKHRLHVDRKHSLIGYIPMNMVLACQRCNLVKNGYLNYHQMKEIAAKYFTAAIAKLESK